MIKTEQKIIAFIDILGVSKLIEKFDATTNSDIPRSAYVVPKS